MPCPPFQSRLVAVIGVNKNNHRCGVTRLGEDWLATNWPTAWVKVLRFCFPMTNDADLLEAAVTLVVAVKSSWSTVENIVQASDDIIKVVQKNEDSLQRPLPLRLLKLILILHQYKSIYTEFLGRWSRWSFNLVTSNPNL